MQIEIAKMQNIHRVIGWEFASLVLGAVSALAFAPFDYAYILLMTLVIAFASWTKISARRAAFRGLLFGLGFFGVGVSWVFVSVHDYGGAGIVTSIVITLVFVGVWSVFPAMTAFLVAYLSHRSEVINLFLLPAVWVLIEALRGMIILNGFPWLMISYSQLETPLAGWLPMIGSYGVSFLLAWTASVIYLLLQRRNRLTVAIGFITVSIWIAGQSFRNFEWTVETGMPLTVTIIQGNVSQEQKWLPANRDKTIERYSRLTKQQANVDVIIWPETAVPAFFHTVQQSLFAPLERWAVEQEVDLVISIPEKVQSKHYYNSVKTFGSSNGTYRKVHLLPFGEYMPFQPVSGYLLKSLNILPVGSFTAGDQDQPLLAAGGHKFITTICYEDVFGNKGIKHIADASYLVNVTNDAWFGDSIEPHQHMQIARMRAIETGRYLIRATNTGVTGFVDPKGKITSQAPMFEVATLTDEIIPRGGVTPYNRYGDLPVLILLCSLFTIFLLLKLIEQKRRTT